MATPSWSACCRRPRLTPTRRGDRGDAGLRGDHRAQVRPAERQPSDGVQRPGQAPPLPQPAAAAPGARRGRPASAGRRHVRPRRHHPRAHADRGERPPPLRRQPARRLERFHRQTVPRRPALRDGHPGGLGPHGVLNGPPAGRWSGPGRTTPSRSHPRSRTRSRRDGRSPKRRRDRCCCGTPACGTPAAPTAATSRATR